MWRELKNDYGFDIAYHTTRSARDMARRIIQGDDASSYSFAALVH